MIGDSDVRDVLAQALSTGGDFAELYAETRSSTSARLDDRRVEELTTGLDRGAGVRVLSGRATAYAYTNRLDRDSLLEAAKVAAAAVSSAERTEVRDLRRAPERQTAEVRVAPSDITSERKVGILLEMDDVARSMGAEVVQVQAVYADLVQDVLIANSLGELVTDRRVRTRGACIVVAARDGVVQTGFEAPGATVGFELFEQHTPNDIATTAAKQALVMLDSVPAPAGEMPVVLAPGGGGVLFHEACGHGVEADGIEKGASIYAGKLGQQVGSELVNGVDDASLAGEWGSYGYDDEATPSRRTSIFEKGVLMSYLADRRTARLLGIDPTGNGRRQSYAHLPVPRMTNTFILPGSDDPDAILRGTPTGLYAKSFSGGQVDPATGDFVFGLGEAYLISGGELTTPVRGATLVGYGPDVLQRVDAVGSDLDLWTGNCGKEGQMVPANVGMPTVRLERMTVGGTG